MDDNNHYKIIDRTPEKFKCGIGACPSVYEGIANRTPADFDCGIGPCPQVFEGSRQDAQDGPEVYLIVGKQIDPSLAGLESKVGEGEVLIEVPRGLIDGMKR